jgi:hypothetical protein
VRSFKRDSGDVDTAADKDFIEKNFIDEFGRFLKHGDNRTINTLDKLITIYWSMYNLVWWGCLLTLQTCPKRPKLISISRHTLLPTERSSNYSQLRWNMSTSDTRDGKLIADSTQDELWYDSMFISMLSKPLHSDETNSPLLWYSIWLWQEKVFESVRRTSAIPTPRNTDDENSPGHPAEDIVTLKEDTLGGGKQTALGDVTKFHRSFTQHRRNSVRDTPDKVWRYSRSQNSIHPCTPDEFDHNLITEKAIRSILILDL